ncbi:hypothetical protein JQK87_28930 [Streptomyces sp. G44]|uniref:hypothetical protein n=1 Tax=Streptomyces sp. G44 TaxID=2807632 RepID=UPI001960D398|nr:hypothetical protein [Streptomyces sp. G44]MBM7172345.1 hypothetical protein [Streptomyces sp. G44]
MTHVLVSPAYGSPEARRHWHDTLDREVPFLAAAYRDVLDGAVLRRLQETHPGGTARFWGATRAHDKKMEPVGTGDVVLFTGGNQVRAVGEIGVIFRSTALADTLWPPAAGGESWHTVYSLRGFELTDIPYAELSSVLGYKANFQYPGQLVLRGAKADAVIDGFLITTQQASGRTADDLPAGGAAGQEATRAVRLAAAEEMRTSLTSYTRPATTTLVRRRESELLRDFRRTLGGAPARRYSCPGGMTDLYVEGNLIELVEAKSAASRIHVRQAMAQLLDYVRYSPRPVDRLIALLPEAPARDDLKLLHDYGIDCVHRSAPGVFGRLSAPEGNRRRMLAFWTW